jgi:hypothetical protein
MKNLPVLPALPHLKPVMNSGSALHIIVTAYVFKYKIYSCVLRVCYSGPSG